MKPADISIKTDHEEEITTINITLGRIGLVVHCYQDEDGVDVINMLEAIPGHVPRRLAFMADGVETKVYNLDGARI